MKELTVLIAALILQGCNYKPHQQDIVQPTMDGARIYVYVYDSCEYIGRINTAFEPLLTHKGNCKYCAQRNRNINPNP